MKIDEFIDRAKKLTEAEWNYILDNLNYEIECNENFLAVSIVDKLTEKTK